MRNIAIVTNADGSKTVNETEETVITGIIKSYTNPFTGNPNTIPQTIVFAGSVFVGGMFAGKFVDKWMAAQGKSFAGFGE